ncbi:autotransporter assembly complex protein TamA [Puniceibacterium sediminis]|uniref:Autotransporter secretion outer membrane protein TamA n=1 Tax=Puniceibacterium sediminis TaxID=1608407 RepID=A0A238WZ66_9RHOB|nr:BamA/TamA family outer membrane protein [Puniceibacterium sediminis]SNR51856.1 autotransporter secretion outer membrane protein TamA [Puniceibacterium sediminis]
MFWCNGLSRGLMLVAVSVLVVPAPADALDKVVFRLAKEDDELRSYLRNASALQTAFEDERVTAQDLFAAALADYGRLLDALYANGYYGPTIDILIDGRQASDIPLLSVPTQLSDVQVLINQGPLYRFGRAEISPLPPGAELPSNFGRNDRARSLSVGDALDAAIISWRDAGYAKASLESQSVVADHARNKLDVAMRITPGPLVKFGEIRRTQPSAVRTTVIRRIASIPTGSQFSPEALRQAEQRLRRTRAFSSVALAEGETIAADGTMEIGVTVVDAKPRRFGFGAEISSLEGVQLSSFWLHRNLFGGAERLRIDGEVTNIGSADSGIDYSLGARLEVPAVLGPDTDGFIYSELAHLDEPTYLSDRIELGLGLSRIYSEFLTAEAGVSFVYSETQDDLGDRNFTLLTFPFSATLDKRDSDLDPRTGFYLDASTRPYLGLNGSQSGARLQGDARYYFPVVEDKSQVLAARLQIGSVVGSDLEKTLPEYLFTSGGGGTVRGQPYQSLDIDLGNDDTTGGRSFVGVSTEYRTNLSGNLAAVAFYDAGYIGENSFYDGSGNWHSGAGLGIRYNTGIGPIRFDVAAPVSGETGSGVQFYIGIGQAF